MLKDTFIRLKVGNMFAKTKELVAHAQDLLSNPLIVPVKILRGHEVVDFEGVLDCAFHPSQPWVFTAGADASLCLFTNP